MVGRAWCLLAGILLIAPTLRAADPAPADAMYDQSGVLLEQDILPGAPKIVLIAGSRSHGPGDHEFFAGTAILQKMLKQNGVNGVMAREGWPKDEKVFEGAVAVMIYADGGGGHPMLRKDGGKSRLEMMKGLLAKGVGFANLHYAVEYPKESDKDVLPMLGGYFEPFWSVNPTWMGNFKSFPEHAITRGVKPFSIRDEWYYHMKFVEGMKGVTPILTDVPPDNTRGRDGTNDAHGGNPEVQKHKGEPEHMAWAYERPDGGRSFGFTGAHYHKNWGDENFRRLVVNALMWTAKVEVPEGGAKVEMDAGELMKNMDDKRPKGKAGAAAGAAPKADQQQLQGDWQVVSAFDEKGRPVAAEKARFVFKGDVLAIGPDPKDAMGGKFRLDANQKPKQIDMVVEDGGVLHKQLGVYELEKDSLKINFAGEGRPRPADLEGKEGLFVLKRVGNENK